MVKFHGTNRDLCVSDIDTASVIRFSAFSAFSEFRHCILDKNAASELVEHLRVFLSSYGVDRKKAVSAPIVMDDFGRYLIAGERLFVMPNFRGAVDMFFDAVEDSGSGILSMDLNVDQARCLVSFLVNFYDFVYLTDTIGPVLVVHERYGYSLRLNNDGFISYAEIPSCFSSLDKAVGFAKNMGIDVEYFAKAGGYELWCLSDAKAILGEIE